MQQRDPSFTKLVASLVFDGYAQQYVVVGSAFGMHKEQ